MNPCDPKFQLTACKKIVASLNILKSQIVKWVRERFKKRDVSIKEVVEGLSKFIVENRSGMFNL